MTACAGNRTAHIPLQRLRRAQSVVPRAVRVAFRNLSPRDIPNMTSDLLRKVLVAGAAVAALSVAACQKPADKAADAANAASTDANAASADAAAANNAAGTAATDASKTGDASAPAASTGSMNSTPAAPADGAAPAAPAPK